MNNMSIRQIVLGGFMIVNLIIVALVGLSYNGTSEAKEKFELIAQSNEIAQEFAKTQQHLLTGMAYINYYFANHDPKDLQTYKQYHNQSLQSLTKTIHHIEESGFLTAEMDNFKKV